MKTFKKALSILLCVVMVFGTVAIAGTAIMTKTFAASGKSVIKSTADLEKQFSADTSKPYIYMGIDYYEEDGKLTDYYVDKGEVLTALLYLKSNLYFNTQTIYLEYDNTFFDVTNGEGYKAAQTIATNSYTPGTEDKYVNFAINKDNADAVAVGINGTWLTTASSGVANVTTKYPELSEQLAEMDFVSTSTKRNTAATNRYKLDEDDYFLTFQIKVLDTVAEKDTGSGGALINLYSAYKTSITGNQRQGKFSVSTGETVTAKDSIQYNVYNDLGNFLLTDAYATFTCGKNPNEQGGGGSTEGKSVIKSTADLEKQFSSDTSKPYIYMGIDYYEEDGKLTDYYVDEGATLTALLYLKSNLYFNTQTIYLEYDNTFFDVTNGEGYKAAQAIATNSYTPGVSKNYVNFAINKDNADAVAVGINGTWLTTASSGVANVTTKYPELSEQLAGMDFVSTSTKRNTAATNRYKLDEDAYFLTFQIKVIAKKEGSKGSGGALINLYSAYKNSITGNQRQGKFSVSTGETVTAKDSIQYNVYNDLGNFLLTDAYATFTLGENPDAEGGKKTAKFVDNDGSTVLLSKSYEAGADIEAPDMSSVEGFIGWADKRGNVTEAKDFAAKMGSADVTFKAVYETDEFDVVLNFDGGTFNGETSKTIKANYGDVITLSEYAPVKQGYDFAGYKVGTESVDSVTVDNISSIASPKATWTAKEFTVKLYLNKEDKEPFAVEKVTYDRNTTFTATATKEGYTFADWRNKADDSVVTTKVKYNNKWTETADKEFYATWTEMDYKFTFMIYDYAKNEWKVFATKFGNEGQSFTGFNDIYNAVTPESVGWDGKIQVGTLGSATSAFTNAADSTAPIKTTGVTFTSDATYYIQTMLVYDLKVKVPVFNGTEYTDEFTTENIKVKSGLSTSANALVTSGQFDATKYAAADGYEFIKWNIENEKLSATVGKTNTTFSISGNSEDEFVATAEFGRTRYTLVFYINDSVNTPAVAEVCGQIGKEISLDGNYKVKDKDDSVLLPTAGLENSEQETPYSGRDGYEAVGFAFFKDSKKNALTFPFVLTQEMVDAYANKETKTINFLHIWKALEYDATFSYKDKNGNAQSFTVSGIPVGSNFSKFDPSSTTYPEFGMAFLDYIKANAPTGTQFDRWDVPEGTISTDMIAGGQTYTAVYRNNIYNIYIDLNNGSETIEKEIVRKFTSSYGDDIEAEEDADAGIKDGNGTIVKRMTFTETEKPSPDCEYVGWKVFHLKDESKGVYDRDNWVEGVNDEGTTIMRGTVIYQPQWKLYNEFFFRVYGNGGTEDLYSALGKNFKMYYWKNHRPCQRGDEELNKSPELNVILGFIPSLENFDFARFFDATMWKSIYLRFDALSVPKSVFTWAGFSGLVTAAWNAIVGLINGGEG